MIVRIFASGKSFKGLSAYLTHDPKADTDERVAWTHTHNLANDHVPSAVNEMLWTARDAEFLKQEAGIRGGGRATETPVKHVSLNWSPQDTPTREHMIATSEQFLEKMGWQGHQAIFIAHSDKAHAHVHLLINAVHPETGLKLNEGFEQRRAQAWALDYEREQGRIDCEQRLKDARDRQESLSRDAWMDFQEDKKSFERVEKSRAEQAEKSARNAERSGGQAGEDWKILKGIQKDERLAFFAEGKAKFAEIRAEVFHGVREDYRERWRDLYAEKRTGLNADAFAARKAELAAEQKATLATRRDEACQNLRASRDTVYRDLLDHQNDTRLILRERLADGLDNQAFFEQLRNDRVSPAGSFSEAASEVTKRRQDPVEEEHPRSAPAPRRDVGDDLTGALGGGLLSIGESLFASFIAAKPVQRTPEELREARDLFEAGAKAAADRQRHERDDADEEWRKRQRSFAGD